MKRIALGVLCLSILFFSLIVSSAEITIVSSSSTLKSNQSKSKDATPIYHYRVKNRYAHDPNAFTQGLIFSNGVFYESTGLYGQSTLRKVHVESGKMQQMLRLPARVFGEGLALWNDRLIQLTWQSHVGFVFDRQTFRLEKQFNYKTEGWGITADENHLIMSDGSDKLYFLDPRDYTNVKTLEVRDGNTPIQKLNELEYVKGIIYANVWHSDRIAMISPATGGVTGWIDLSGLRNQLRGLDKEDVLNGIAYDLENDRLFVTGKRWPAVFEITVLE